MMDSLFDDDFSASDECAFCSEAGFAVGKKAAYGSVVVYRVGTSFENSWFATISPKTGGDPARDFTLQLMPCAHLTHFAQMSRSSDLEKNFGVAFARLSAALTLVMGGDFFADGSSLNASLVSSHLSSNVPSISLLRENAVSIGVYGKSTNWKEKKEHLHIKLFPFRGVIGQPYTVDSTFEKKEVFTSQNGERFVKMEPVVKRAVPALRFEELSRRLIGVLDKSSDKNSKTSHDATHKIKIKKEK